MSCNNVTEQAIFDKVVTRLTPWFPDTIMQQIKAKKKLTAVEIIRLLSILPKQAYSDFLDIPNDGLVFPKDHKMHFLQSQVMVLLSPKFDWHTKGCKWRTTGKNWCVIINR